jgi:probable F420-dependent oxidoreductase
MTGTSGPSRSSRPVRFGFQLSGPHLDDPVAAAHRAEELGFDVVTASDHVGSPRMSPMLTLAAIATATTRIRLGTFVLNNDMRNPVQLAWEAVTLDRLSGGRFELGLGAGHTPQEYAATGLGFDPPSVRKARLIESVGVIRRLVDGETVDFQGEHVQVSDAEVGRSTQERLPILVGGNGARLLGAAGELADIVGLQGLGRTLPDGHQHDVHWTADHLTEQVDQVRAGAVSADGGDRSDDIEFNALVQVFSVTDDRDAALTAACQMVGGGLSVADAAAIPYLLIGSVDQIVEHVHECRDRWGITYFVVRSLDDFAPVLDAFT